MGFDLNRMRADARLVGKVRDIAQEDAPSAVPQLVRILEAGGTSDAPAKAAVRALQGFGPEAVDAIPILQHLAVNHGDDAVRLDARVALSEIRRSST